MADIVQRIVLDGKAALETIADMGRGFQGISQTAGDIGGKLASGLREAAGSLVSGAQGAALGGIQGAINAGPFQSRALGGIDAILRSQISVPFLGDVPTEAVLGATAPEALGQFRAAQASAMQVGNIAEQIGAAGGTLTTEERVALFDALQAQKARGLKERIGAFRDIDPHILKEIAGVKEAFSSIDGSSLNLRESGQVGR